MPGLNVQVEECSCREEEREKKKQEILSYDLLRNENIIFFTDVFRDGILHGLTLGTTLCFVTLSCNLPPQHLVMQDRHEFVGRQWALAGHWHSLRALCAPTDPAETLTLEDQNCSPGTSTPGSGTDTHLRISVFPHCFNAPPPPRWYEHSLLNVSTINNCRTRCLGKGHGRAWKVDVSNCQSPNTLFYLTLCLLTLQYQAFFFHSLIWPSQTF